MGADYNKIMIVSIESEKIKQALRGLEPFVSKKSALLPAYHAFLLSAQTGDPGQLSITIATSEGMVTHHMPARVAKPGKVAVQAHHMCELVELIPGEHISLTARGTDLGIETQINQVLVKGYNPEEFVKPSTDDMRQVATIPGQSLASALKSVTFAGGTLDFSNLELILENHRLICVATDGFRLARKDVNLSATCATSPALKGAQPTDPEAQAAESMGVGTQPQNRNSIILPITFAQAFSKLIDSTITQEETWSVAMPPNNEGVQFSCPSTSAYCSAIAQKFHAWRSLFEEKWGAIGACPVDLLKIAMQQCLLFSDTSSPSAEFRSETKDGCSVIIITAQNAQSGFSAMHIPCPGLTSLDIHFRCNPRYLLDGLKRVTSEHVDLFVDSNQRKLRIQDANEFHYILAMQAKNQE